MKRYSQTIANRLTKRVMLTVLATMVVTASIVLTIAFRAIKAGADGKYQTMMNVVSEKLGRILLHEEICARNVFDAVNGNLHSPKSVMRSLEKEIKLNSYAQGYYVAFEPGYFPQYEKWFEPYMRKGEEHARNIGSAAHDYLTKDWYIQAKKEKGGFWTDPYYDNVGGQDNVCAFAMPLYDRNGCLVGVCGADMSLKWLVKEIQEIDADSPFYTFIISRDGTYIAHPDGDRVLRENVVSHVSDDGKNVVQEMMQMKRGKAPMTIDGVRSLVFYAPLESTKWSMAIVVPLTAIWIPALMIIGLLSAIIVIGLLVVWLFCRSNIRQIVSPLGVLAKSADEVSKGNFEAPLPVIGHRDEVCELRDSFAAMQHSLVKYVQDLKDKTAKEAALQNELALAQKLQMSMIPNVFPPFPERTDIDIYGMLKPAKSIGGDLFDFFIRDERLFFCIGDVSGKGIPAALLMTVIHYLFRIISGREDDPKRIVELMNDYLSAGNKSLMFCTFFLGVLDLKTHLLKYCNAGHELPILMADEVSMIPVEHNLAMGLFEKLAYKPGEIQLKPGNVFLLCTDGVKEAINQEEECFEKARMIASLQQVANEGSANAADYVRHLVDSVADFVKDAPQADDITLLAIKI